MFPIRPLGARIILKFTEKREKSDGGIIIPDRAKDPDQLWICEVMSVGPGRLQKDGSYEPLSVKPGDKVLIDQKGGNGVPFNYDGWRYLATYPEAPNIYGVVED